MSSRWLTPVAVAVLRAFLAVAFVGVDRYGTNYWLYRGFPPPHDPAYVTQAGSVEHIDVASEALGGRRQEVYVYLPPGYASHPAKHYPVLYLLHGFPGRPLAFLLTGVNVNDSERSLSQIDAIASIGGQSTNIPAKAAYLHAGLFQVVATQRSSRTFIGRIETLPLTT